MVGVWVFMGLSVSVCWKCLYKHWDGTALRESHPGWGQSPSAHLPVLTGGHHPRAAIEKVPVGTKSSAVWLCGVSVEPDALHTDRQCHLRGSW